MEKFHLQNSTLIRLCHSDPFMVELAALRSRSSLHDRDQLPRMTSDTKAPTNGAGGANGLSELRTLEEALTGVNSLLDREGEELSERDLAKLLKDLEAADNVAEGVESKLDELLKNLEGMLDGLEGTEQKDGDGANEPTERSGVPKEEGKSS